MVGRLGMLSAREQLRTLGITIEDMEANSEQEESTIVIKEIADGPEMQRVFSLPRRPIPDLDGEEATQLATFLTKRLAKTSSPYPGALRPVQAVALKEAWQSKGLFAPIPVGGGKMLTAFLLPAVLGISRCLYLCPASMGKPTRDEFAKYREHWHGPTLYQMPVVHYELLSAPSSAGEYDTYGDVVTPGLLDKLAPKLIVMDEAHKAGATSSALSKRIDAYVKRNPDVVVCMLTGTPFNTSIKDATHLMRWSLKQNAPLPQTYNEREPWASFLDAKKGMGSRALVGDLVNIHHALGVPVQYPYTQELERSHYRRLVGRRVLETPGVVSTQTPVCSIPITMETWLADEDCHEISKAIESLFEAQELPDGSVLADGEEYSRHLYTMGLGFWQKLEPPPPIEWRAARNAWAKWCRRALKANRKGVNSEATMKAAVRKGTFDDKGLLKAWEEARNKERARTNLREPPSVAQWISDEVVQRVAEWIAIYPGLVWVAHIGLGERLAEELGIPYYGAGGGKDVKTGKVIEQHTPRTPAIASHKACGIGKNIQRIFSENLWLCAPHEQSLARTHRPGQTADVVRNFLYLGCSKHLQAWDAAKDVTSRFRSEINLSSQKMDQMTIDLPTHRQLESRGGRRWAIKDE